MLPPDFSTFGTPVARDKLDSMGCHDCGDDNHAHGPMFLHSRCHSKLGTEVCYQGGVLYISCIGCQKPIAAVAVADQPQDVERRAATRSLEAPVASHRTRSNDARP